MAEAGTKSLMVVAVAVAVVALLCWLAATGPTEPRTLAPGPFPPRPAQVSPAGRLL